MNRPQLKADLAEISRAIGVLFAPGDVVELRALDVGGITNNTHGGYFSDFNKLANEAARLSGQAAGVYFTLNRVKHALLARASNRVKVHPKNLTQDANILSRRWLPVDVDPEREAGISSTDAEHESAVNAAKTVKVHLMEIGFPPDSIVVGDSGNGGLALIRTDLPNDAEAEALVKDCQKALAAKCDNDHVSIDLAVSNAARIWKLPGTLACKGDSTADRPHRIAKLLDVPTNIVTAPIEAIRALAATAPAPEAPRQAARTHQAAGQPFDLESWLVKNSIEVQSAGPYEGGTRHILKACPFNPEHTGTSVAVFQTANGALGFKCQHSSCADKTWADLRELKEPGYRDRKDSYHGHSMPPDDGNSDKKRTSVATRLVELAGDIDLIHTAGGIPYAVIKSGGHVSTWPLGSRAAKDYMARRYYEETGGVPHSQALQDALNVLRGRALFDGREEPVYTRLAACAGRLYLDLCDSAWRVVEITTEGWEVISLSPVRFARSRGMAALPIPQSGGNVDALKDFLNVAPSDWPLLVAWLVSAFMPAGPYPVLVLTGEQGSAKSTAAKVLRSLVDPSTVPLRSLPRDERDLAITASNSWVIALDNVSNIPPWLSDAISRLATGGGFATRELYTDADEVLFAATRPVVLNGIGDIATRSDLLDRAMILTLPTIPDDKRRTEAELWGEFDRQRPPILAALLAAVTLALRDVNAVRLDASPRMADFAKWVVAAAPALGMKPRDFLDAYTGNRRSIHELALESSPVGGEIVSLAREIPDGGDWTRRTPCSPESKAPASTAIYNW